MSLATIPISATIKLKKHGLVIEKFIGKGAFGNVYTCRKTFAGYKKKYAAKIVEFGEDNKIKWQTENEIEILKEVSGHSNIVGFHGVMRDSTNIMMILEYIPGSSFLEGILNWPRFNENEVKRVVMQLLEALRFCHSKSIIHRDISPENLLWFDVPSIKRPNATPLLKLIDFNLSRKIPEDVDYIQADALGNPSYMAPECLEDQPIANSSTDVWSVGVLAFLLLSGYPPFFNDNYNHLLKNIVEANYVFPQHLWSHVTEDGKNIVREMLQSDFDLRPSSEELVTRRWFHTRVSTVTAIKSTTRILFSTNNPTKHDDSSTSWKGQRTLKGFLRYLHNQKTKTTHRTYSLVFKEREPFIPDDHMIKTFEDTCSDTASTDTSNIFQQKITDLNNNSDNITNLSARIHELELKRQAFHW